MLICGVDEAGRGPLAGNVVAAAVILNPDKPIAGLNDSKKLSQKKREQLFGLIIRDSLAYAIAEASVAEIDELNILQASLLAMKRAINALNITPDKALIDGNKIPSQLSIAAEAIIGGDALIAEISAASILAKVTRDQQLIELDKLYPNYGFAKHKGYGTKLHLEAIAKHGVINGIHRTSFAPIRQANLELFE
ncbi:MAG: ribonuclease HII [Neisseriales bacterium]|jgi:ribonuclease HII|nr:MAG: ribonuclease HII [Neisseriales bacterium]